MALTLGWQMAGKPEKVCKKLLYGNSCSPADNKGQYKHDAFLQQELCDIIAAKKIKAVFQPIVSLNNGEVVGYESLSRGPQESRLERPDALFAAAEEYQKVWELDVLCRAIALSKAKNLPPDKMLFINVDPKIMHDERFRKGVTKEMLAKYQLNATNIIFEITEKTSVEDYNTFRQMLDNYTSQGYQIAIDDTGSGYSGLRMLAEVRPQFIKIDMGLVRDIDKDYIKQAMMKAFREFTIVTNMKIIAEGIETEAEMKALIDIGVHYGQGYYLQRPAAEFLEISPEVKEQIQIANERKQHDNSFTPLIAPIGKIARHDLPFASSVSGADAIEYFNTHPNLMGVPVVDNDIPVGLLMRDKFFSQFATQYGVAVYTKRSVELLMNRQPLIVDYSTPLEQVTSMVLGRNEDTLYDFIIITKNQKYYGITTIRYLLEKTTQLEIYRAKHCNPLSGLPGNILIEQKLKQMIESDTMYAVLYFDLDNFKAYNDVYGFDNGDKIIGITAQIIQTELHKVSSSDTFIGHIGGDDFIAVLTDGDVSRICQNIIDVFDARVRGHYNEDDLQRGYIVSKNRHGAEENFPVISLSIAVVSNRNRVFIGPADLAEAAGVVKKKCKMEWRSCYHIE